MHFEHADLLLRVWNHRHNVQVTLQKVKAHASPVLRTTEPLECFWEWGNEHADHYAKQACLQLCPQFVSDLQTFHEDLQEQRQLLQQLFKLHLALKPVREAANEQQVPASPVQLTTEEIIRNFSNWRPSPSFRYSSQVDTTFLAFSAWGEDTTRAVFQWMTTLEWECDLSHNGPSDRGTGVTWSELACSFLLSAKRYLPIQRKDDNQQLRVLVPGSFSSAKEMGTTISEQGSVLRLMIDHIIALVPQQIFPTSPRSKVTALYILGLGKQVQGMQSRPAYPNQSDVAQLLARQFSESKSLTWLLDSGGHHADIILPESWEHRKATAKAQMSHARRVRAVLDT
eukprot:Skav221252  [mRNA]  locus=scaffold1045:590111:591133:+ [translate_table: standard]